MDQEIKVARKNRNALLLVIAGPKRSTAELSKRLNASIRARASLTVASAMLTKPIAPRNGKTLAGIGELPQPREQARLVAMACQLFQTRKASQTSSAMSTNGSERDAQWSKIAQRPWKNAM